MPRHRADAWNIAGAAGARLMLRPSILNFPGANRTAFPAFSVASAEVYDRLPKGAAVRAAGFGTLRRQVLNQAATQARRRTRGCVQVPACCAMMPSDITRAAYRIGRSCGPD